MVPKVQRYIFGSLAHLSTRKNTSRDKLLSIYERGNDFLLQGSILVVSSENGDPMAEFRNLAEVHRQRQLESQKATEHNHIDPAQNYWFSESTNICFLLLHDVQKGSEAKAQEVFANLKQTFGATKAFILRVNTGGNNGEAPDPWGQFSENQKMRLCDGKDQDSIRSFVKDLSTGMEEKISK